MHIYLSIYLSIYVYKYIYTYAAPGAHEHPHTHTCDCLGSPTRSASIRTRTTCVTMDYEALSYWSMEP